jgi:hypothetical protein
VTGIQVTQKEDKHPTDPHTAHIESMAGSTGEEVKGKTAETESEDTENDELSHLIDPC